MKAKLVKTLKIIIPLTVGVYLTWYFFSGLTSKELEQTKNAFFEADYLWVSISLVLSWLSHFSRAYRWLFVLEPLGYKPSLANAYHAVMSGYVLNYTVPRSGEVARAALMAGAEGIPFEKGFATIVVERIIDLIMFGLIFLIGGMLQVNSDEFKAITQQADQGNGIFLYVAAGGFILGLIALFIYFKNNRFRQFVNQKALSFFDGLRQIWKMKRKWSFLFHTLFIWTAYVVLIWVGAQIFEETKGMSLACVFGAFIVGSAAIGLLPGGLGAYPAWVNAVLVLYGIQYAPYGIFIWSLQTLLILVLGLISFFIIQQRTKLPNG